MSSKIKHNKKRNTAFLYEALVRELTKATFKKDTERKNTVISILKEFFKNGKPLARELKLYQNIVSTRVDEKRLAEKIIFESRLERVALDNKALFNEQSALLSRINKELSQEVYSNFVPNYKDLATLDQIFNNTKTDSKQRVLLEEQILQKMIKTQEDSNQQNMPHIDNIVYKTFVEKFNNSYSGLSERQQGLIKAYVASTDATNIEMKVYLDEEIGRLKEEISTSDELEIFPEQKREILNLLETYSDREVASDDLKTILKIQELVEESKKDD